MCQGLNSHYFHIIGDGHPPNIRGLYTHYNSYWRWDDHPQKNATTLSMALNCSFSPNVWEDMRRWWDDSGMMTFPSDVDVTSFRSHRTSRSGNRFRTVSRKKSGSVTSRLVNHNKIGNRGKRWTHFMVTLVLPSLKQTGLAPPKNRPKRDKRKPDCLPTIHFQGLDMLVSGRVISGQVMIIWLDWCMVFFAIFLWERSLCHENSGTAHGFLPSFFFKTSITFTECKCCPRWIPGRKNLAQQIKIARDGSSKDWHLWEKCFQMSHSDTHKN